MKTFSISQFIRNPDRAKILPPEISPGAGHSALLSESI
jgi:hypothetical protein